MKILYRISHINIIKALVLFSLINFFDIAIHVLGFYFRFVSVELDYAFYGIKILSFIYVLLVLKNNKVQNINVLERIPSFIKGLIVVDLIEIYFSVVFTPLSRKIILFFLVTLATKTVFELLCYTKLSYLGRANNKNQTRLIIANVIFIVFAFALFCHHGPKVNYIFVALLVLKLIMTFIYLNDVKMDVLFCGPLNAKIYSYNNVSGRNKFIKLAIVISILIIAVSYTREKGVFSSKPSYVLFYSFDDNDITFDGKHSFINREGEKVLDVPWVVTADISYRQKCFDFLLDYNPLGTIIENKRNPIDNLNRRYSDNYFKNGRCIYYSNFYKKYGMLDDQGNIVYDPIFIDVDVDLYSRDCLTIVEFDDNTWNILDDNYEWISEKNFIEAPEFMDGTNLIEYNQQSDGSFNIIDGNGSLWEGQYSSSHNVDTLGGYDSNYVHLTKTFKNVSTSLLLNGNGEILFESDKYQDFAATYSVDDEIILVAKDKDGYYNFINLKGDIVVDGRFSEYSLMENREVFDNKFIVAKDDAGLCRFFTLDGIELLEGSYNNYNFVEGKIYLQCCGGDNDGKLAIADFNGNIVYSDEKLNFVDGSSEVSVALDDGYTIYNYISGEFTLEDEYWNLAKSEQFDTQKGVIQFSVQYKDDSFYVFWYLDDEMVFSHKIVAPGDINNSSEYRNSYYGFAVIWNNDLTEHLIFYIYNNESDEYDVFENGECINNVPDIYKYLEDHGIAYGY